MAGAQGFPPASRAGPFAARGAMVWRARALRGDGEFAPGGKGDFSAPGLLQFPRGLRDGDRVSLPLLRPADLDAYLLELPVAAAVLPRLQMLLLSDDANVADVVELIRFDPSLATRVMHAAASAYYGRSRDLNSLEEAVALLGLREAYRVTAAFALSRYLNTPLRIYGLGPAEYWRRSLACALLMETRALAQGLDECVAYTAGLLHSLGMVLIDRHLRAVGDPGTLLREFPASPITRQEQRLIGMNHAQVAGLILRRWSFGSDVVAPIEFQFEPARAPAPQAAMTALLARARSSAVELIRDLPPPGQGMAAASDESEAGDVGARILAVERWLH